MTKDVSSWQRKQKKKNNCDEAETFKAKTTQNPADECDEMGV